MTRLAEQHKAVNLSQGFPNEPPPPQGVAALICGLLGGTADRTTTVQQTPVKHLLDKMDATNETTLLQFIEKLAGHEAIDLHSQYSYPFGRPKMREMIQKYYETFYPGRQGAGTTD